MSFKIHLIIIAFIVLTVYLAWEWINAKPAAVVTAPVNQESAYSIIIAHASWGLNCRNRLGMFSSQSDSFATSRKEPLREDNILVKVSELCNGKLECSIPLTSDALGSNPAPDCLEKEIVIEYRCFSYDRPWTIKSVAGPVTINCDRSGN